MPAKKPGQSDRISALVRELEAILKRVRADIRKRAAAAGVVKQLEATAAQVRKRAAAVAAQIEKYVHELRMELERTPKSARKTAARKKTAARRRTSPAPGPM